MTTPQGVVFDCNVFFQSLISPTGPARRLFRYVTAGNLTLCVSSQILDELHELITRPEIVSRYRLVEAAIDEFFADITRCSTRIDSVPHVFDLPRDPDDAHYVDLAVAANATLVVSRDKDLLSLRDQGTIEGRDFAARFPEIQILTPPELIALIATP